MRVCVCVCVQMLQSSIEAVHRGLTQHVLPPLDPRWKKSDADQDGGSPLHTHTPSPLHTHTHTRTLQPGNALAIQHRGGTWYGSVDSVCESFCVCVCVCVHVCAQMTWTHQLPVARRARVAVVAREQRLPHSKRTHTDTHAHTHTHTQRSDEHTHERSFFDCGVRVPALAALTRPVCIRRV